MKAKKLASFIFKTKKRITVFCALLVIIIIGISCLINYNPSPAVDTTALNKLLLESSDLTTAKLKITNMSEYKDTGIKILNKSDFIMVYEATVWAGINVKEVKIVSNDLTKTIHINIPKAIIQEAKVDPKTIKYFDEKFSLFNVNEKEDANEAISLAEERVKKEAIETGILELADKQSATLIEGLLSKAIPPEYTLVTKITK